MAKTPASTTTDKKKRVYEVAREFNLSSVAMVEQIRSLGFEVKNHMAVCRVKNLKSTIEFLRDSGLRIISATEKGNVNYNEINYEGPISIIVGSEESGISASILQLSDDMAKIPILGKIESLNVSVATGIILYEAVKVHQEQQNNYVN